MSQSAAVVHTHAQPGTLALLGGTPIFDAQLDWRTFWPPVDQATAQKLQDLYLSGKWTAFDEVEPAFAKAFAEHHGARHGIFMINGTVTLQCALGAYDIGPGDEVIVPALTWYATAMAAHYLRATPVLVDIDPSTLCIDPQKVRSAITARTKAIVPVHLYGSMADMDEIIAIAGEHKLRVIEDCAHMHGGVWDGKGIGTLGEVGSFSFQHSKTMASAEGGICITDNDEIAERIFRMKQIGYGPGQMPGKVSGPPAGLLCYPFRATAFQALILHQQLEGLNDRLERYSRAAAYLEQRLAATTRIRFQRQGRKASRQGYFGWVMIFDHPYYEGIPVATLQKALNAEGVPVMPTWDPVYRFILFNLKSDAYRVEGPCAVTEQVGSRILWLLHAFLGLEWTHIERIADAIEKVSSSADALREHCAQTQ